MQPAFSTWGVWLPQEDPLWQFCDAAMHWACYADWPHRERFASTYFQFWVEAERGDPFWHRAHLDHGVLVTVNPHEPIRSAWVHLRATGSRICVKLDAWGRWLKSPADEQGHEVLSVAVRAAKATLMDSAPTPADLLAGIDQPRKREVVERFRVKEQERRDQQCDIQRHVNQRINRHNAACHTLMRAIKRDGHTCPHCGVRSREYRLSKRQDHKSAIICTSCGWPLAPTVDDPASGAGDRTEAGDHA